MGVEPRLPADMADPSPSSGAIHHFRPVAIGVIFACAFIAYLPALRAGFIWDDDYYITNNESLKSLSGLKSIWLTLDSTPQYYPMVFSSFWLEYHIWGPGSAGYHFINIVLHATNAALLLLLLRRLKVPGAMIAAMLFALHPVQVESVAWITERKNVLSLFFYLISFHFYASFAHWDDSTASPRRTAGFYALALAAFQFALFSKTVTCSLPAAILLVVYWRKGSIKYADILPLTPFFVAGVLMAGITAKVEHFHVGAMHLDFGLDWLERICLAGRVLCFYVWKLFWPSPLIFIYPRWDANQVGLQAWLFPCIVVCLLTTLFILRQRLGRGALVCVLFFAGTLVPALGFIDVYPMRFSWVADHFQYIASIGIFVLIGGIIARVVAANASVQKKSFIEVVVIVFLCFPLAALVWRQTNIYRDLETLWRDTLSKNPTAWIAQTNLAAIVIDRNGNLDEAQGLLEEALRLNRQNVEALICLGTLYRKRGDIAKAGDLWQEAVERQANYLERGFKGNSEGSKILCEMADNLSKSGRNRVAILYYQAALRNAPDYSRAAYNLASLLIAEKRAREAVPVATDLVDRQPNNPDARNILGLAFRESGNREEAIKQFIESIRCNPNLAEAHFNIAQTYSELGDTTRAIEQFKEALRLDPNDAEARSRLETETRKLGPGGS